MKLLLLFSLVAVGVSNALLSPKCKGTKLGVYYPDENDRTCRKYYSCAVLGIVLDKECPIGTTFDSNLHDCNKNAGCKYQVTTVEATKTTTLPTEPVTRKPVIPTTIPQTSLPANDCSLEKSTKYADPADQECRKYIVCFNCVKLSYTCGNGKLFSKKSGLCNEAHLVQCIN